MGTTTTTEKDGMGLPTRDWRSDLPSALDTQRDSIRAIETIVDKLGLDYAIQVLALVCIEKAEHIRENWQDTATARPWDRMATALSSASARATKFGLTR